MVEACDQFGKQVLEPWVEKVENGENPKEVMSLTLSSEAASSLLRKIPLKRPGTAEELAGLVADLSAQKMAYLTGQVIRFNGGMYM